MMALFADYARPWAKTFTIARIPRTADAYADHALADLVINAFELAAAADLLLQHGTTDGFGQFSYSAPPRRDQDAIARLRSALQGVTPPPTRCGICRVKA